MYTEKMDHQRSSASSVIHTRGMLYAVESSTTYFAQTLGCFFVLDYPQLRKQLHSKIEMVETIYDQEHQKFSSELGKQAASLTPRIQVCLGVFAYLSHAVRDSDGALAMSQRHELTGCVDHNEHELTMPFDKLMFPIFFF